MTRELYHFGRMVLPSGIRKTMNIKHKDTMGIYMDGNTIVLKK